MKLPGFNDFKENPTTAIAFILVVAIGYLYMDQKTLHAAQLQSEKESCARIEAGLQDRVSTLEQTIIRYEDRLEEINEKLLECLDSRK